MWSKRIIEAQRVGMVVIDEINDKATIFALPNDSNLSDDDWLVILRAASEIRQELESHGYRVLG